MPKTYKVSAADAVGAPRGCTFEHSASVVDGRYAGLVIDQRTPGMHTDERLDAWLEQVKPLLLEKIRDGVAVG